MSIVMDSEGELVPGFERWNVRKVARYPWPLTPC